MGLYLSENDLINASALLIGMPQNTVENIAYYDLYSMYIDLANEGKTLWDLDSAQLQLVRSIASICPTSLAVVNAQAVLHLRFGEEIPECPEIVARRALEENEELSFENYFGGTISNHSAKSEWNIFPNPNDGNMRLNYSINERDHAYLSIFNLNGELLFFQKLNNPDKYLETSNILLNSGVYFYKITINDEIKVVKKLVVIN